MDVSEYGYVSTKEEGPRHTTTHHSFNRPYNSLITVRKTWSVPETLELQFTLMCTVLLKRLKGKWR